VRPGVSSFGAWTASSMRILYGVVGEGMGHATRSHVVLEHLLGAGHEVRVVVSGRAHGFLVEALSGFLNVTVEEIHGLTLRYFENRLDKTQSLYENLKNSPKAVRRNVRVYRKVAEDGFRPDLVISDFESWAALYALNHFLPVISIDNMQVINRCRHDDEIRGDKTLGFRLAKAAVKLKLPGAYHYLVSSFFFPQVRKKRTTLIPPILRRRVLEARREPGDHIVVYQRVVPVDVLASQLKALPYRFRVYGAEREGRDGNVTLCAFSDRAFIEDLRTARAVVAGAGFTLMSEAVSLKVPMLAIPIAAQYEQELNARYLARLGYGAWSNTLDTETLAEFLRRSDEFSHNLQAYPYRDNEVLYACLDELLALAQAGAKRPKLLTAAAPGKWRPKR
jgi:uncharacterized protein (TIGR00661 family)